MNLSGKDIERFWSKVDKSGECWTWTGAMGRKNYGVFRHNNRTTKAHRFAYEMAHGAIPAGMFVCHTCDNPSCVNPAHLWVGTPKENSLDMVRKGRTHKPGFKMPKGHNRGERSSSAKMTWAKVHELRARRAAGERLSVLAAEYGIAKKTVQGIVSGRYWKVEPIAFCRTQGEAEVKAGVALYELMEVA